MPFQEIFSVALNIAPVLQVRVQNATDADFILGNYQRLLHSLEETVRNNLTQLEVRLSGKPMTPDTDSENLQRLEELIHSMAETLRNNLTRLEDRLSGRPMTPDTDDDYEEMHNQITQMENLRRDLNLMQINLDHVTQEVAGMRTTWLESLTQAQTALEQNSSAILSRVEALESEFVILTENPRQNTTDIWNGLQGSLFQMNNSISGSVSEIEALRERFRKLNQSAVRRQEAEILQSQITWLNETVSREMSRQNGGLQDAEAYFRSITQELKMNFSSDLSVMNQTCVTQVDELQTLVEDTKVNVSVQMAAILENVTYLGAEHRKLAESVLSLEQEVEDVRFSSARALADVANLQRDGLGMRTDIQSLRDEVDQVKDNLGQVRGRLDLARK